MLYGSHRKVAHCDTVLRVHSMPASLCSRRCKIDFGVSTHAHPHAHPPTLTMSWLLSYIRDLLTHSCLIGAGRWLCIPQCASRFRLGLYSIHATRVIFFLIFTCYSAGSLSFAHIIRTPPLGSIDAAKLPLGGSNLLHLSPPVYILKTVFIDKGGRMELGVLNPKMSVQKCPPPPWPPVDCSRLLCALCLTKNPQIRSVQSCVTRLLHPRAQPQPGRPGPGGSLGRDQSSHHAGHFATATLRQWRNSS